jgi:hypothetical protein
LLIALSYVVFHHTPNGACAELLCSPPLDVYEVSLLGCAAVNGTAASPWCPAMRAIAGNIWNFDELRKRNWFCSRKGTSSQTSWFPRTVAPVGHMISLRVHYAVTRVKLALRLIKLWIGGSSGLLHWFLFSVLDRVEW